MSDPAVRRVQTRERVRPLTVKERRFIDAYLGSCNGNGSRAAITAGYARKSARIAASQLLTKPNIQAVIHARQQREARKAIMTAENRDAWLSMLAQSPAVPPATQVAAIKELNKVSGRHSIRHVMDVTEKLSDIIAASRAPE